MLYQTVFLLISAHIAQPMNCIDHHCVASIGLHSIVPNVSCLGNGLWSRSLSTYIILSLLFCGINEPFDDVLMSLNVFFRELSAMTYLLGVTMGPR